MTVAVEFVLQLMIQLKIFRFKIYDISKKKARKGNSYIAQYPVLSAFFKSVLHFTS